jgi:hypothetical protein
MDSPQAAQMAQSKAGSWDAWKAAPMDGTLELSKARSTDGTSVGCSESQMVAKRAAQKVCSRVALTAARWLHWDDEQDGSALNAVGKTDTLTFALETRRPEQRRLGHVDERLHAEHYERRRRGGLQSESLMW